jgi:biopolymer transport protein ExbD
VFCFFVPLELPSFSFYGIVQSDNKLLKFEIVTAYRQAPKKGQMVLNDFRRRITMENVYGNQMHLLKKMDYKGFMASFCGVLLPVFLLFFIIGPFYGGPSPHITLFEVKNYQYEFRGELLTIEITKEGEVWFYGKIRGDNPLSKLEGHIEDTFEANARRDVRIQLKADQGVPYGKIVEIFQILPRVGIKSVFLVTEGTAYPIIEFIAEKKLPI